MKIVHIINGLDVGGAELMLSRLVLSMQHASSPVQSVVVSLSNLGLIGTQLQASGIEVIALNCRASDFPGAFSRVSATIQLLKPDVVQTWLYRSDLIGGLAARWNGIKNIAWGIRCSEIPADASRASRILIRFNAVLSRFVPKVIVCCAEAAREFHAQRGFDKSKLRVIPNGADITALFPNATDRNQVREQLGYAPDDLVVGIVGRYDELKDHANFINAAATVAAFNPMAKFLMVGRGIDSTNNNLVEQIEQTGFKSRFTLLGERQDVPRLMRGMDFYCLSSRSEGFPNVVLEAMASGLPCVVTNVGDAAVIAGDTGIVVPPADSQILGRALIKMAGLGRTAINELGERARSRIVENYSLTTVSEKYFQLYRRLIDNTI